MKGSVKEFLSRHTFEFGVLLLYFIIVSIVAIYHEPWRDEAEVWLLARDLSFPQLIKEMGYEGTPALWYLMVMPLAKLSLPYFSMTILHILISTAAIGVFLLFAPFSKMTKVLFVFSYYMIYEYAVIARSYALSILLLFVLASVFRKRHERPLLYGLSIALLFNTNTHNLFPAAAFMLMSLYAFFNRAERQLIKKKHIISFCLMLMGAFFAIYQLIPPADSQKPGLVNEISWFAPFEAIADAFLPTCLLNPASSLFAKHWSVLVFFLAFFFIAWGYLYRNKRSFFFFSFSFLGLCYIFIFKHSGYLRHFGFILIYLITAFWISEDPENKDQPDKISVAPLSGWFSVFKVRDLPGMRYFIYGFIRLCLLSGIILGAYYIYLDITRPFSGSRAMAKYMAANHIDRHFIAAYNVHTMVSLLPYLPGVKFWDPGLQENFTHIHWDNRYILTRKIPAGIILDRVKQKAGGNPDYYMLLPYPLPVPADGGFRLVYQVEEGVTGDENYYLYQPLTH
jgi:hypothetical protein